jgi:poly(3-hydroxybutyrate) depolymerase
MSRSASREARHPGREIVVLVLCFFLHPAARALADTTTNSLVVDGSNRTFIVHVPPSYGNGSRAFPVLLMFHGMGSTAAAAAAPYYNWQATAESNRFIVAFPESLSPEGKDVPGFPDYDGTGKRWDVAYVLDPDHTDSPDVDFTAAILDWLEANYNVRTTHVFTTGHSYGAYFSYYVSVCLDGRIKAFAEHSGGLMTFLSIIYWPIDVQAPPPSIPGLLLHSPGDPTVAYSSSELLQSRMNLRGQTNLFITLPDTLGHGWDKANNQAQWDFFLAQTPVMDDDADDLPDTWEMHHGLDLEKDDAEADPDHDGAGNLDEYRAGTDPQDDDSVFKGEPGPGSQSDKFILRWSSVTGKTYSVLSATNPGSAFISVTNGLTATPPVNIFTAAPSASAVFYRMAIP